MSAVITAFAAGEEVDAQPMRGRPDHIRLKAGEDRSIVTRDRTTVTVRRVRHRDLVERPER